MKFLIDECLSPKLATIARTRGFPESTHVTWLGLRSRQDWALVRRAIDDGYVLVTNDRADFTSLMEREPVHSGLVCVNMAHGLMSLAVQQGTSYAFCHSRPRATECGSSGTASNDSNIKYADSLWTYISSKSRAPATYFRNSCKTPMTRARRHPPSMHRQPQRKYSLLTTNSPTSGGTAIARCWISAFRLGAASSAMKGVPAQNGA